jgi:nicotinic acid mononucleotide adenylyltransferase
MIEGVTLVYGGSFDPPHAMHACMATAAADAIGAGVILVLPAGVNPQRTSVKSCQLTFISVLQS